MDVVVSRAPGSQTIWNLTDRLGRRVGQITRSAEGRFIIAAADYRGGGPLGQIAAVQPSLDAAMNEVANRARASSPARRRGDALPWSAAGGDTDVFVVSAAIAKLSVLF